MTPLTTGEPRRLPFVWQREMLHVAVMFMEAVWCIPLFIAVAPGASLLSTGESIAIVIVNLAGSLLLVRFLTIRHVSQRITWWIFLGGVIAASAVIVWLVLPITGIGQTAPLLLTSFTRGASLVIPPMLLTVALVIFLWYRGLSIATALITPVRASFGFRLGIVNMIVLSLIPSDRLHNNLIGLLPLFFFAGLMATTLARAASLRLNRDAQRASFGGRWLGFTGGIGLLVSAVGYVFALFLAGYGAQGIAQILQGILSACFAVITVIVSPLLYLLDWLLRPVAASLQNLLMNLNVGQFQNQINLTPADSATIQQNARVLQAILDVLKYSCLAAVVIAVLAVFASMLRNRVAGKAVEGEEHESLEGESLFRSLRSTLGQGLRALLDAAGQFGAGRSLVQTITIRRLYARLLARAAELGYPRDKAQTPLEYQGKLETAFPGFPEEIGLVTRAYVNAHYGELPETPEALHTVQTAVERMIASSAEQATATTQKSA